MFQKIGVDANEAVTMIPFLHKDRNYLQIPGRVIRINNLEGYINEINRLVSTQSKVSWYQDSLPEIPLIPLDLGGGFPIDFGEMYGRADLLIVNHGVILRHLNSCEEAGRRYLRSIENATKVGSALMVFDNPESGDFVVEEMAELIGARYCGDMCDLGYLDLPECDKDGKVVLLQKK